MVREPRRPEEEPTVPEAVGPGTEPSGLSPDRLLAASLASVAAATITSRFGEAGTIVGAAITPIVVILAGFALETSLERARRAAATRVLPTAGREPRAAVERRRSLPGRLWFGLTHLTRQRIVFGLAAALIAFLMAMLAVTVIESVAGRPLSGILRDGAKGGTTLDPGDGDGDDEPSLPIRDEGEERPELEPQEPEEEPDAPARTATQAPSEQTAPPTQTSAPPEGGGQLDEVLP